MQTHRTTMANVLRAREVQLLDRKYWNVIGGREIGAKAEWLRKSTWAANEAGFEVLPRTVLAMEMFPAFKSEMPELAGINYLGHIDDVLGLLRNMRQLSVNSSLRGTFRNISPEIIKLANRMRFDGKTLEHLERAFLFYPSGTPIAVRSSAYGDCNGTGTYESVLLFNCGEEHKRYSEFREAVTKVLLSQFSEDAMAFRKDHGLPLGMAVMIEPVFGRIADGAFAPDVGGYIRLNGVGGDYTVLCGGLPTSAVKNLGLRIKRGNFVPIERLALDFINCTPLSRAGIKLNTDKYVDGDVLDEDGIKWNTTSEMPNAQSAEWLFKMFDNMQRILGLEGLYAEYAAIADRVGFDPRTALLQIAPLALRKEDYTVPKKSERTIATSEYVEAGGIKTCSMVFYLENDKQIPVLHEFNKTNSGYLLIVNSNIVVGIKQKLMRYSDANNASAIIEGGNFRHEQGTIGGHLFGAFDSRGIVIIGNSSIDFAKIANKMMAYGAAGKIATVYDARTKVVANRSMQEAVVDIIE